MLAGCAGERATEARRSDELSGLAQLLPSELDGKKLTKEVFTGEVWLETEPERYSPYFSAELRADLSTFLELLRKSPSELSVAWASEPAEGIQVLAYRVRGADEAELVRAYVRAVRAPIRTQRVLLAGKNVTVTRGASVRRGYLYAKDDVLYSANTFHVAGKELEELLAKLPPARPEPAALVRLLPQTLGGVELRREAFAGDAWLKAMPELSFQAELDADIAAFLRRLDESPADLTVAWALAPEGPKVTAYRVIGAGPHRLVRAYVFAVKARVRTRTIALAGKEVTLTMRVSPRLRGYLYASGDVLYAAGSTHTSRAEVEELLSELP
jgi:hypothetical protein